MTLIQHFVQTTACVLCTAAFLSGAQAQTVSLALQEGGTASWEIAAMQDLGLDTANGITLDIRPVADSRAGQVALLAGAVDLILSDFIWVSVQRDQGADVTFVPHSLAVGGVMVPPGSDIATVGDLAGKTIAVAGGPIDKSYLVLQAYYAAQTGQVLTENSSADFGAPPLVNEMLQSGQADAALNFWHFNARSKAAGLTELVSVADMLAELGVTGKPPLLGWVFTQTTAAAKPEDVAHFLTASFDTKDRLLTDDALWDRLRPVMNVGDDEALFVALRDGYRAGIVTGYGPQDIQSATQTYALMAQYGGVDLVGQATELAPGTFWDGFRR